jgi:putative hydrolase of the HAD superfamily
MSVLHRRPTDLDPIDALLQHRGFVPGRHWALFDADNTLWHIEHLYDRARDRLCDYLAGQGFDPVRVEALQREIDRVAFDTFRYSEKRFPQSFVQTLLTVKPEAGEAEQAEVRSMAETALTAPATTDADAGEVLAAVKRSYLIGVVTAGEPEIQKRRLRGFDGRALIDAVWIVPRKTRSVFDEICEEVQATRAGSWVIGDSLQSDILPAHAAGLNTILVQNPNWSEIEGAGHVPRGTFIVPRLKDIIQLIVG